MYLGIFHFRRYSTVLHGPCRLIISLGSHDTPFHMPVLMAPYCGKCKSSQAKLSQEYSVNTFHS